MLAKSISIVIEQSKKSVNTECKYQFEKVKTAILFVQNLL